MVKKPGGAVGWVLANTTRPSLNVDAVRGSDITAVHDRHPGDRHTERDGDGVTQFAHSGVTYAAVIPPSMISD